MSLVYLMDTKFTCVSLRSSLFVVFFCERERRSQDSNERSGASAETAKEKGERRGRLARFPREDRA